VTVSGLVGKVLWSLLHPWGYACLSRVGRAQKGGSMLTAPGHCVPALALASEHEPHSPLVFPPTLTESHATNLPILDRGCRRGKRAVTLFIAVRSLGPGEGKRKWLFKKLFRLFHNLLEDPALRHPCEFLNHLLRSPTL
jgi:hypothetical protein